MILGPIGLETVRSDSGRTVFPTTDLSVLRKFREKTRTSLNNLDRDVYKITEEVGQFLRPSSDGTVSRFG